MTPPDMASEKKLLMSDLAIQIKPLSHPSSPPTSPSRPFAYPSENDDRPRRGPVIIHAGLMRSGTLSMARAYATLGLRAHHIMDDGASIPVYAALERAAEATWPWLPSLHYQHHRPDEPHPPEPYTRKDWDALFFDSYDVATDSASFFVPQLLDSYPEARVVVVQRDFESWWPSFRTQVLEKVFVRKAPLRKWLLLPLVSATTGFRGVQAVQKMVLGAFGVDRVEDITEERARRVWEGYYALVRARVPEGRRLEYRLGEDGWGPLCAFLGRPVPDEPFPRVNDRASFARRAEGYFDEVMEMTWAVCRPYVVGLMVVMMLVVLCAVVSSGGSQETAALIGSDVATEATWLASAVLSG